MQGIKYMAHVCNSDTCNCNPVGAFIMMHQRGYDEAFERFAEDNPELKDDDIIHVFRYNFTTEEPLGVGYFGKFKNWKPSALNNAEAVLEASRK